MKDWLLELDAVDAGYDKSHVLHGISMHVNTGEVVGLLGRNGMGKTTTLKTIAGLMVPTRGAIRFAGESLLHSPVERIARQGISLVPDNRGIFTLLSVQENLKIAARPGGAWDMERIYAEFPRLKDRRSNLGGALSGGEQQMLSIARALMQNPRLLMLDEPTEGLAPVIVDELVRIIGCVAAQGLSIILVEQNYPVCRALATRHYILEEGAVVFEGSNAQLDADPGILHQFLGLETC